MESDSFITRFGPGEEATSKDYSPGDFILTHNNDLFGKLIRFGQGLRYWGRNRKYAHWNHAALIVSEEGDLIEALSRGVVKTHLSHYKNTEYHLVDLRETLATNHDREEMVAFAEWSWHQPYGWVTITSIALTLRTGCKFTFGVNGESICSGLVARALERTRAIFPGNPANTTPAALAQYFAVPVPPPKTPIGAPPNERRGRRP
jgi:uncharacterized protein YycO